MTPSASPPVQRPFGRQFDGPSPTKKRRLSRTPSLLGPAARSYSRGSTSSSSVQPPAFSRVGTPLDSNEDLHSARRASSFKVLNVWSNLADKYARRLDEDDIVDLENETIIKDYGVLSSSDDMYEIGCFADQHELEDRQSEEELLIAADDEPDELDAFNEVSESGDRDVDLKFSGQPKRLPPVRELDPADAADLAEFLEAEKTRKEKFGDLGEEEEDREEDENEDEERRVVGDEDEEFTEDSTAGYRSGTEIDGNGRDSGDSEEEETYEENVRDEDDSLRGHTDYRRVFTPSGSPEFDILGLTVRGGGEENSEEAKEQENASVLAEDDTLQVVTEDPLSPASDEGSEDELGAWEQDEGNTLYSLDNLDDNDSDVDNIGTDDFDDGPVILEEPVSANEYTQSPTPTLKSPRVPRTDKTKGKERAVKSDQSDWMLLESASSATSASPATVFQLQTPPRSSSFGPEARVAKPVATYSRKKTWKF
ncbi:hypothetical protein EW145_g827 [Phellinidium pouzarii]|uniref:Uncharacterized protein n=1 Tax=Phellinidium pouzarii TaxID=167371 RepID=A0A4V6S1B5_9AGAM|nr:hypothetical protein EW145_g827 [Phellinidium pouzarii]